jgi:hypothetical protein
MSWLFTKHRAKELDPVETNWRHEAGTAMVIDVREAHELRGEVFLDPGIFRSAASRVTWVSCWQHHR